jgi:hypothetical protein
MSDLFMRFCRPPYPTRVFRDERAALEWLAQFLPQDGAAPDGGNRSWARAMSGPSGA